MILLKKLRKHINQFVTPELTPISDKDINFYPDVASNTPTATATALQTKQKQEIDVKSKPDSFQEVHKKSYSHGLENIYTIETIDLKTVTTLTTYSEKNDASEEFSIRTTYPMQRDPQLEFNFEGAHRVYYNSFILNEPIYHLELSQAAQKALLDLGYFYVGNLIDIDIDSLNLNPIYLKELKEKLEKKTLNQELRHCQFINFDAWIKSLIPDGNRLKFYLLLECYQLSHLIKLTAMGVVELKRLSQEEKRNYINEAIELITSEDRIQLNHSYKKTIANVFLAPWIRSRLGIVKEFEILEFLEQLSDKVLDFDHQMRFLSNVYMKGTFLFNDILEHHDNHIYFSDHHIKKKFKSIEKHALSYFINRQALYELSELTAWLEKELARQWDRLPDGFIEKTLRTSSLFSLCKNEQQIIVALA